jgi:TM2 domain-containing membrane protein YozV
LKEKAIAYKYRNDFRVTTKWKKGDLASARLPERKCSPNENKILACEEAVNYSKANDSKIHLLENKFNSAEKKVDFFDVKPTLKEKVMLAKEVGKIYKELPKQQKKEIKKEIKKIAKTNAKDRSQIITLILAGIFFITGVAGIHRFYLGGTSNIIIGVVQLLTLGCCGIWWLIDVIRILTGDLKPPTGNYNPEL